ncbi:MAG: energy transducer TonB [Gemmatimonadota bacterium]|nr:energy transducer TonB [Gemmatimonadota bacterium]
MTPVGYHRATHAVSGGSRKFTLRLAASMLACPLVATGESFAQALPVLARSAPAACLDTVSLINARPRIAYIYASVPDSSQPLLGEMADQLAQSVAQRARVLLNAHGDTLPAGEPSLGWRNFRDDLVLEVTALRNGSPRFALVTADTNLAASKFLLHAVQETQATGDGLFWPPEATADSITFGIGFAFKSQGRLATRATYRYAFPVFSVLFPPETPAARQDADVPYPENARQLGATGVVIIEFKVDSLGHVAPETLKEQWPAEVPRPTGALLSVYTDFLQTVMAWLPTARFSPARVGGCPVSQLVSQTFTFDLH